MRGVGPWHPSTAVPRRSPGPSLPGSQVFQLWRSSGSRSCCLPTASSTSPWRSRPPPTAQRRGGYCVTGPACSVSQGDFCQPRVLADTWSHTARPGNGGHGPCHLGPSVSSQGGTRGSGTGLEACGDPFQTLAHRLLPSRSCRVAAPCGAGGFPGGH